VSPASGDALAEADGDAAGVGRVVDVDDVARSEGVADPVDPPQPTTNRASITGRIPRQRPRRVPPLRATTLISAPPAVDRDRGHTILAGLGFGFLR